MELIKTERRIRCEMGACKNPAAHTIKFCRVGIRSRLHVCAGCISELYKLIGALVTPKGIENVMVKKK